MSKIALVAKVEPQLKKDTKKYCAENEITISELVSKLLVEKLND